MDAGDSSTNPGGNKCFNTDGDVPLCSSHFVILR